MINMIECGNFENCGTMILPITNRLPHESPQLCTPCAEEETRFIDDLFSSPPDKGNPPPPKKDTFWEQAEKYRAK